MNPKVAIITTIHHNVGDDFIREGIKYLLRKHFKNQKLDFNYIHKHSPITVRNEFEKVRLDIVSHFFDIDKIIPQWLTHDKILGADILVQSGAPVFWCHPDIQKEAHCADNEWYQALIKRRFEKIRDHAKLLNLAAGSCQAWHSSGDEVLRCTKCTNYINDFVGLSDITTLRDNIAKSMLNFLGLDAPVIPCTSIFAIDEFGFVPEEEEYVVLNFMKGGAHFSFGQEINSEKWFTDFKRFYQVISKENTCVFVCHDKKEERLAKMIDHNAKTFIAHNYTDYLRFYSKAKFGIMNRIHGAFPIMSYGRPAVIIGNDSRAKMAEVVGSKSYFVNDMDFDSLMAVYDELKKGFNDFKDRFTQIKTKAYQDYMQEFSKLNL